MRPCISVITHLCNDPSVHHPSIYVSIHISMQLSIYSFKTQESCTNEAKPDELQAIILYPVLIWFQTLC